MRFGRKRLAAGTRCAAALITFTIGTAMAQSIIKPDEHISFDRPEAWGLKYFASVSLLSGFPVPEPLESHRVGNVTIALELDWIPQLDTGQRRIGFNGTTLEDLNKAPVFARPMIRIELPAKFTFIAAAPPPFHIFGITPHLLAFGVERPLVERGNWTFTWRGYGQVGSIKGAFTCPKSVLAFPPGSPQNPVFCVAESADVATLRYAGSEFQLAFRPAKTPKLIPHIAAGGNFIDGVFQTHALEVGALDETRLWTHGGTFSTTGGVTYLVSDQAAFTVDVFYSPLWVKRNVAAPLTNDGLFNVRALFSYTFRRGSR